MHETVRRMIDTLVTDLIRTSAREHRAGTRPASIDDVRQRAAARSRFSAPRARAERWS